MSKTWSGDWPYVTAASETPTPKRGNVVTRKLCQSILKLSGFKMIGEIPEVPKLIAVVGPHTSNWDFVHGMSVQYGLGVRFSFMIKSSVFVPVLGSIIRFFGGIPINRTAAHGVTEQMVQKFAETDELILVITPEGTRSKKGKLKSGFHRIAQQANVPVLVVSLDYKSGIANLAKTLPPTMSFEDMEAELNAILGPVQGRSGTWLDRPLADARTNGNANS